MPSPQGPQEAAAGLPPNHPLAILASVSFRPGRRNSIPRQSSARQADPDTPSYPSRPPAPGRSLGEYLSPSHSEQSRGSWARGGGAGGGGGGGQHEREKWRLSSGPPERVREEGWAGGAGGAGSSIQVDRRLALSPAAAASIFAISPFSAAAMYAAGCRARVGRRLSSFQPRGPPPPPPPSLPVWPRVETITERGDERPAGISAINVEPEAMLSRSRRSSHALARSFGSEPEVIASEPEAMIREGVNHCKSFHAINPFTP